jgi:hypothetical protein
MKTGCGNVEGWIGMSDQVMLRVLAALDNGEERKLWGRGIEAFIWSFQAALAARACSIPRGVRRASGPLE